MRARAVGEEADAAQQVAVRDAGRGDDDVARREILGREDAPVVVDPELAQLVDLKFFCGFSITEIAEIRCVSERTVQRDWEKARLYLHRALKSDRTLS